MPTDPLDYSEIEPIDPRKQAFGQPRNIYCRRYPPNSVLKGWYLTPRMQMKLATHGNRLKRDGEDWVLNPTEAVIEQSTLEAFREEGAMA